MTNKMDNNNTDMMDEKFIEITACEEGGYVASHTIFPVSAEGETKECAINNLKETFQFFLEEVSINDWLKSQIDGCTKQIKNLNDRRSELECLLISQADTFPEKFMNWLRSTQGGCIYYIPNGMPELEKYINGYGHFYRGQHVNLYSELHSYFEVVFSSELSEQEKDDYFIKFGPPRQHIEAIAKEIFDANLKSFTFDW